MDNSIMPDLTDVKEITEWQHKYIGFKILSKDGELAQYTDLETALHIYFKLSHSKFYGVHRAGVLDLLLVK